MHHGIKNEYMYAVTQLTVTFTNGDPKGDVAINGTGFFVLKDKEVYLITNRHMVDLAYNEEYKKNHPGYVLKKICFDVRHLDKIQNTVIKKNFELATFQISYASTAEDDIACLYELKVNGTEQPNPLLIPYDMLATSDFINNLLTVCDSVAFIGFPAFVSDVHNNMPVLRGGVISSDPRLDYNNNPNFGGHVIAYEAFSTGGASGSPVFALQKGFQTEGAIIASEGFFRETKLIGINGYHLGSPVKDKDGKEISHQHLHISLMYKADQIRTLIDRCEAMTIATAPITTI